eukprot:6461723-Ditylum_brightwellii.AAC.1
METLSVVLNAWPKAARGKDYFDRTQLHSICGNESASLEMLSVFLNTQPRAAREKKQKGIIEDAECGFECMTRSSKRMEN